MLGRAARTLHLSATRADRCSHLLGFSMPSCSQSSVLHHVVRHASMQWFDDKPVPPPRDEPTEREPINDTLLPSREFILKHCRSDAARERLANIVGEVQLLFDSMSPPSLPDDSLWMTLMHLNRPMARAEVLSEWANEQFDGKDTNDNRVNGEKISEVNARLASEGRMVYAPGFHQLLDLQGKQFRSCIDYVYGSRVLAESVSPSLPRLLLDCRFLPLLSTRIQSRMFKQVQDLHDGNWTARVPFPLSLCNYRPDAPTAAIAKRHLLFMHGPPGADAPFQLHPLAPRVSPAPLTDSLKGLTSDEVMYVSWRATRFFPDEPPPTVKAVVVCASQDNLVHTSSLTAAGADRVQAYRIPIEKHIKLQHNQRRVPSLRTTADIIKMYWQGYGWEHAIKSHFNKDTRSPRKQEGYREFMDRMQYLEKEYKRDHVHKKTLTEVRAEQMSKLERKREKREKRRVHPRAQAH